MENKILMYELKNQRNSSNKYDGQLNIMIFLKFSNFSMFETHRRAHLMLKILSALMEWTRHCHDSLINRHHLTQLVHTEMQKSDNDRKTMNISVKVNIILYYIIVR